MEEALENRELYPHCRLIELSLTHLHEYSFPKKDFANGFDICLLLIDSKKTFG